MAGTFCFQHFPPTTGILPILFNRKANNCFDFPAIFRPTKPQLNWNENQILMKQTMKRHRADWWRKDPTGGGIFILQFSFCFSFAHNPLFYSGSYIVAVLVATLSVFCLQFSVCQYFLFVFYFLSFNELSGAHTTYTHTHTPPVAHFRPPWAAMNRLSSNANRFTVSYANFLSFFCAALSICDFVFLFYSGHLPNAFASHILIYCSRGQ